MKRVKMHKFDVQICQVDDFLAISENIFQTYGNNVSDTATKSLKYQHFLEDFLLSNSDITLDFIDLFHALKKYRWVMFVTGSATGQNALLTAVQIAINKILAKDEVAQELIIYMLLPQALPAKEFEWTFKLIGDRIENRESLMCHIATSENDNRIQILVIRGVNCNFP